MKTADESKPSILSSPLLPSPSDDQYSPITYNHHRRPYRDLPFSILFLLLSLSTFSLGIFSSVHSLSNNSSCNSHSPASLSLSTSSSSSSFVAALVATLILTLLVSFPVAFSLLTLLRHFAKHLVYISAPLSILLPASLNVYWFVACQLGDSCRSSFPLAYRILVLVAVFFVVAIVGWIVVSDWRRVGLTVEIVRIASAALGSNAMLLVALPCLALGSLAYFGLIVAFLVLAANNGRVVAEEGGDGLDRCEWRRDGWVPGYFALAIVTLLWSFGSVLEAKVYVTSGVIARWYFFVEEGGKPRRSIRNSLRYGHAFFPKFLGFGCGVLQ